MVPAGAGTEIDGPRTSMVAGGAPSGALNSAHQRRCCKGLGRCQVGGASALPVRRPARAASRAWWGQL